MPSIRERLTEDLKAAMRAKAKLRLSTIRMMRSEILYKDKEHGQETGEEDILKVLLSMVKKGEEAAEQFVKGGREELASKEREEIRIIQEYLPAQMDDEELRQAVQAAIAKTGASSLKEMGKVMGLLTKQLAGRATGARISQVVKERLSG
ncbi:MAG: GatB/YqeY domain-containing protein [Deltaproteobacteria bacterium]|nr:GatB/YqeY domain-containing protein [Deltaproteobacteria bacterium]MCZ6548445.1 GatB/YqeY domain-containing protein [Deltaproteobacteria bacterium]MCZ6564256.1 GatB/YqeY domain-containing protein [Deltaproteobacteria bacterium]